MQVRGLLVAICVSVAGCGGGGGGGGGDGAAPAIPVTYSGSTAAATLTALNAGQIVANLTGGTGVVGSTGAAAGGSSNDRGALDIARQLNHAFDRSVIRPKGGSPTGAIPINDTSPCDSGGSVTISGTVSDNGTGTVSVTYSACQSANGYIMSGLASLRIDAFDLGLFLPTDGTLTFTRLTVRGAFSADITGSLRTQVNVATNSETLTENVVTLYVSSGRLTKSENLAWTDVYDNVFSPTSYVESINGRLYDSVHGYVDISTVSPFVFGSLLQEFPHAGEVVGTGAGNSRVSVAGLSHVLAKISVDLDGNGIYERTARLAWDAFGGPAGADLNDDDGDGMHNSWETAFMLNPANGADGGSDADGDGQSNLAEYLAGSNPLSGTAPPPPPPGGTPTGFPIVLSLAGNRALVYDPWTLRLYAAVGGNPGSIVPLDPVSATFSTAIPAGNDPSRLAISDDGQFFYVGLNGAGTVQRIPVTSPHTPLNVSLDSDPFFGPRYADDIAVLPGSPGSFAVSMRYPGSSPRHAGVAVFDNVVMRPNTTPTHTGSNVIEFSASAATLYGYNNETTGFGFYRLAVTGSGVSVLDVYDSFQPGGALISGFGTDIEFGGGLVFATDGAVVDPVARTRLGTLALPVPFGNLVVADAALNRVFYLTLNGAVWEMRAFDTTTRLQVASETVPGVNGTPGSLVRWGPRGLAFRTSADQIFLINSTNLIP
jgi:hypothetical protein